MTSPSQPWKSDLPKAHSLPSGDRFDKSDDITLHGQIATGPSAALLPPWMVYILRCSDDTLYTGITTDLERRLAEHNAPAGGSKYTRARQPVVVVYVEAAGSRSEATRRERHIKALSRTEKQRLISSYAAASPP